MAFQNEETPNIAVFVDYENVAIGATDSNYPDFDIQLILAQLIDKGSIVVRRSYADWSSFRQSKRQMHEASFEMIEIPHVSYSGKNSADIRLVVDALDLSYTKQHVQIFCLITGDSDFSPLVSKLRENNKYVIGVGVKKSASRLLVDNCDEYIFYDDLVLSKSKSSRNYNRNNQANYSKEKDDDDSDETEDARPSRYTPRYKNQQQQRYTPRYKNDDDNDEQQQPRYAPRYRNSQQQQDPPQPPSVPKYRKEQQNHWKNSPPPAPAPKPVQLKPKEEALEALLEVVDSIFAARDEDIYGAYLKQMLKRQYPDFVESAYGYTKFNDLIEDSMRRKLLHAIRDPKTGGYIVCGFGENA